MNLKHMHVNKVEHVNVYIPNGWMDTTNFSCSIYERYFALAVNLLANSFSHTFHSSNNGFHVLFMLAYVYVVYVLLEMLH